MSLDQNRTPLFDALRTYCGVVEAPMHVPGHKMGRGAAPEWSAIPTGELLALDVTEAPGLDDLHAPEGVIAEAQHLAAAAFGAAETFFLVGGSTAGLQAILMAALHPGQSVLVPRNAHRSILGAMILADARPVWVPVHFQRGMDVAVQADLETFRKGLSTVQAAVCVHPTYHGITGCVPEMIADARSAGVPVIVDEAHGSHFGFHPDLPKSALAHGADAVVQSMHKMGGSLTQSSLCHLSHDSALSPVRVREMLRLVQSTSPSYLLMASLDLARRDLVLNGEHRWTATIYLAAQARAEIAKIEGLAICQTDDPGKLVIDVRGLRLTGFEAAQALWKQGVAVEMAGLTHLLAVLTPGVSAEMVAALIKALRRLPQGSRMPIPPPQPPLPIVTTTPRAAYLGRKRMVRLSEAVGSVAAEIVAPYPPGIPVVAPGELITREVVDYLQHAVRAGYHLQGPADRLLSCIQVVEE